jgi:DNA-binding NtrC family response regulator
MPRPNVLLIDRKSNLLELRHLLDENCDVISSATASDALSLVASQEFDVFIIDLELWRTRSSLALVKALHELQPDALNIVVTESGYLHKAVTALLRLTKVSGKRIDGQQVAKLVLANVQSRKPHSTKLPPKTERLA